jgi:hypothetical protein
MTARVKARAEIVEAAQRHRQQRTVKDAPRGKDGYVMLPPPFTARHLQRAVCVARRNRLVKPAVLVAAGFRAEERR